MELLEVESLFRLVSRLPRTIKTPRHLKQAEIKPPSEKSADDAALLGLE